MNERWSRLLLLLATPSLVGLGLWFLLSGTAVQAEDHTVCASGCDFTTIQEALDDTASVNDGDTIVVAAGTYTENLTIIRSINIAAAPGAAPIIDGRSLPSNVIFVADSVTVTLSGLMIRNGNTVDQGGGIFNESDNLIIKDSTIFSNTAAMDGGGIANLGQVTLNNVTLEQNNADFGGGIFNQTGVMTLTHVLLTGNSTTVGPGDENGGGGIYNDVDSLMNMTNVTFTNNLADEAGGGLWNFGEITLEKLYFSANESEAGAGIFNDGRLTVTEARIEQNQAGTNGGGIQNSFELTLTNSTIDDNNAPLGGGIYHKGIGMVIDQTTISNNTASGNGAGIYFGDPFATGLQLTMVNSTVSGNNASGNGGGIYLAAGSTAVLQNVTVAANNGINGAGGLHLSGGQLTLENSIVADNDNGDCAGNVTSAGHNTISDATCMLGGSGDDNGVDPRLGSLADNGGPTATHALLAGSVAIDRGLNCPAVDQRGVSRPIAAGCDRGAFETSATTQRLYIPHLRK